MPIFSICYLIMQFDDLRLSQSLEANRKSRSDERVALVRFTSIQRLEKADSVPILSHIAKLAIAVATLTEHNVNSLPDLLYTPVPMFVSYYGYKAYK